MDLKTHIGSRLRLARLEARMTQDELADVLGRSTRTISAIESGQSSTAFGTLEALAIKLGKPLSFFFEGFEPGAKIKRRTKAEETIMSMIATMKPREISLVLALLRVIKEHSQ